MKFFGLFLIFLFVFTVQAQTAAREFDLKTGGAVEVKNLYGRVSVSAEEAQGEKVSLTIQASKSLADAEVKTSAAGGKVTVSVNPEDEKTRVDLTIKIPLHARVKVETREGEVRVAGEIESAEVTTETGTISTDVPLENLKYNFQWTASRPRYISDVELEEVKEKSGGRFSLSGKLGEGKRQKEKGKNEEKPEAGKQTTIPDEERPIDNDELGSATSTDKTDKLKTKDQRPKTVSLNFTTTRGILLLNVNPAEVPNNLQQRPLTEAAKAIIRSGDSLLTEAIRRASPKYFGDYAKTLPPSKREPTLTDKPKQTDATSGKVKRVLAKVVDANNRAIAGLQKKDFTVLESGKPREILSVETTTAPFNLILLLDVSGSVENYVDFIRKAARNFIDTVDKRDRIAVLTFNEDVKVISNFTTDRARLSESLDTFDAGGGTAYYDALAFSLVDTLRPLKGERTAIVVLSDGDDNRSFLPFESLLGSLQESGALVYPLYVPSGLIAASAQSDPNNAVDPLRTRYMGLTTKAEAEGARLAQISGGVYYPIRRLAELQQAYDDIVVQLRTAYTITYRSDSTEAGDGISPRLRVRTSREGSFVNIGTIVDVPEKEAEKYLQNGQVSLNAAREIVRPQFSARNRFLNFNFQNAEISGEIEKVNYRQLVNDALREYKFENFDINKSTGAFLLANEKEKIAVSRWISPKRTRSYPYERVYDTLAFDGKKATIIPVVKDEGLGGERDFLQWDTISLLSLLDVHVILAYYSEAEKNTKRPDQITAQKFDNNYIQARLKEVFDFEGSPRQWNERETKQLKPVFEKARAAYREISKKTNTYLHDETALNELITFAETPQKFIDFSRRKAQNAQSREFQTLQPKEALSTDTKGKVTIANALFGKYFFTVDETKIEPPLVYLIEAKHSQRALLPSKNDIKDGLIKMMLYTNLRRVKVGAKNFDYKVMIRLTSARLKGSITSDAKDEEQAKFFSANLIDAANREFLKKLFREARENKFTIVLEHALAAK